MEKNSANSDKVIIACIGIYQNMPFEIVNFILEGLSQC